jgi:hypothetical protein
MLKIIAFKRRDRPEELGDPVVAVGPEEGAVDGGRGGEGLEHLIVDVLLLS